MEEVKKFQDLRVGETYIVQSYYGPYNSRYGISYILNIANAHSSDDSIMQIWSTNLLAEYISKVCSYRKFTFTVHERQNKKYPMIEGYIKQRKFKELQ